MKNKILIALTIILMSIGANAQEKLTPIQFNDRLAMITDTLYNLGSNWGTKFAEVYKTQQFSSLAADRKKMEQFFVTQIAFVKNMKDVGDSKELRMGMVNFLLFEQKMLQTAFLPVERLSANSTQEQTNAAIEQLTTESKKEAAELEKFRMLQEAYAAKNGFTIEAKKEE